ncbi:L,D-transpeptidase family protein [Psychromonas hadalis]|uniref:L,D-transpeptidase family protein n=1 Tax=Psychromonas hadalis TaxID=211669 RepID=UPI0003B4F4C2|nr:L,D-transpeptidase family protein [Psychromonas hadalis]
MKSALLARRIFANDTHRHHPILAYIKFLALLLLCFFTVYANSLVAQQVINTRFFTENKTTVYQHILQQSEKKYLWFDTTGLTLNGVSLNTVLADLGWYEVVNSNALSEDKYQQHDQRLTLGFLQLININQHKKPFALASAEAILLTALKEQSEDELLFSLLPEYDQISHLRKAISYYRHLSASPWPKLDVHFQPRFGQSHKQVKGIRKILTLLGDLPVQSQSINRRDIYDSVAVKALKKFQQRHGLVSDGKLSPDTYATLQISPEQRLKQLQANLRRWFILPNQPPDKFLLINIPGYQLSVIENGLTTLQMKVIVGDINNQTPLLITQIDRITLNPTWTPTVNIINSELIPSYQQDFLSLQRSHFQLIKGTMSGVETKEIDRPNLNLKKLLRTYRLVQAPGENNALGYYRFNIPNTKAIYLHDTPVKSLFNQPYRALSHGCVRLQDANLLANYLLSFEDDYKKNAMYASLQSGKTIHLPLSNSLAVYITYQTTWFDKQGGLRFLPDIYGLD